MTTTIQATALPYSLADDAPFQLTVFFTHKLVGGQVQLSDYPAAADWVNTLAAGTLSLTTSVNPATPLPLRVVSQPDAAAWAGALPPDTPVAGFPEPKLSEADWHTNPASRLSDHAVDLHLAAITAAPTRRPPLAGNAVAGGLLTTLAALDQDGPLARLLREEKGRGQRAAQLAGRRLRDALTTIGPLTGPENSDQGHDRGYIPDPPAYQSEIIDVDSPIQVLLEDPDADNRLTKRLDGLVGKNLAGNPNLQLMVDAHAMRRYYERPEQPHPVDPPVGTPSGADDRAHRAARRGRQHRGRGADPARPADRRRPDHVEGGAGVTAAAAVRHVVQLPGAGGRPGRQLGAAGGHAAASPGPSGTRGAGRGPRAPRAGRRRLRPARRRRHQRGVAALAGRGARVRPDGDADLRAAHRAAVG